MTVRAPLTVGELERWQEYGAIWRPLEVTDDHAIVELCTCYGEPVERREGGSAELIQFVRAQRAMD